MKETGHPDWKAEALRFFNHYESNGWMVGKNRMKKWQAAVSSWLSRNFSQTKTNNAPEERSAFKEFPA